VWFLNCVNPGGRHIRASSRSHNLFVFERNPYAHSFDKSWHFPCLIKWDSLLKMKILSSFAHPVCAFMLNDGSEQICRLRQIDELLNYYKEELFWCQNVKYRVLLVIKLCQCSLDYIFHPSCKFNWFQYAISTICTYLLLTGPCFV